MQSCIVLYTVFALAIFSVFAVYAVKRSRRSLKWITSLCKVLVSGVYESGDGTYRMTDKWANGRGVYKLDTVSDFSRASALTGSDARDNLASLLGETMNSGIFLSCFIKWIKRYQNQYSNGK